mmetsp:Transcript_3749/g.10595  ORF Transcript_3749/g.10595 Transcript_3749/m.10595 type:complete len:201 (+) Transcript_3749:2477-3079(+)
MLHHTMWMYAHGYTPCGQAVRAFHVRHPLSTSPSANHVPSHSFSLSLSVSFSLLIFSCPVLTLPVYRLCHSAAVSSRAHLHHRVAPFNATCVAQSLTQRYYKSTTAQRLPLARITWHAGNDCSSWGPGLLDPYTDSPPTCSTHRRLHQTCMQATRPHPHPHPSHTSTARSPLRIRVIGHLPIPGGHPIMCRLASHRQANV